MIFSLFHLIFGCVYFTASGGFAEIEEDGELPF